MCNSHCGWLFHCFARFVLYSTPGPLCSFWEPCHCFYSCLSLSGHLFRHILHRCHHHSSAPVTLDLYLYCLTRSLYLAPLNMCCSSIVDLCWTMSLNKVEPCFEGECTTLSGRIPISLTNAGYSLRSGRSAATSQSSGSEGKGYFACW